MQFNFSEDNWAQVWNTSLALGDTATCPILLSSPCIALLMSAPLVNNVSEWYLGAYIQREVFSGLTVGGSPDARLDGSRKLYLNRLQVFTYPTICEYSLKANCRAYGGGVQLFAYEYTGEIN